MITLITEEHTHTGESAPQQGSEHDWYFSFSKQAQMYKNGFIVPFCYAYSIIGKTDSDTCIYSKTLHSSLPLKGSICSYGIPSLAGISTLVVPLTESRVLFAIAVRLKNSVSSAISSLTASIIIHALLVWGPMISVESLKILASLSSVIEKKRLGISEW